MILENGFFVAGKYLDRMGLIFSIIKYAFFLYFLECVTDSCSKKFANKSSNKTNHHIDNFRLKNRGFLLLLAIYIKK